MRVAIDNQVLAAAKDGLRTIVIRPTLIYGRGIGVASTSVQLPKLIDVAKKHGVPRHVGRGLNIWGHVHIADVVSICSCWRWTRRKPGSLFYAENGEANFKAVTQSIGRMLGLGDSNEGLADRRSGRGARTRRLSELRVEQPRARQALARARLEAEGRHACSMRSRRACLQRGVREEHARRGAVAQARTARLVRHALEFASARRSKTASPSSSPTNECRAEEAVRDDRLRPARAELRGRCGQPRAQPRPFNAWMRSPEIGMRLQDVGAHIRFKSSIPKRLNELAILVTAREWTSQYEWYAHHALAMKAGLDPKIADAIAAGAAPRRHERGRGRDLRLLHPAPPARRSTTRPSSA